jgi:hypothetical protein
VHLQAGQYTFNVTPPSTLPDAVVLGSPLGLTINPGPADQAHCTVSTAMPASPVLGSAVAVEVSLADGYGNPVSASDAGRFNTTKLVFSCAYLGATARVACSW